MKVLDKINNDQDVKKLDLKQQKKLATEIRELIINTSKQTSLHLSSNLGIVELTISLFKNFNLSKDKLLYDTGHQTYVHKILTGRKDKFHTIRQEGGLTGFVNMQESVYDHYSPGHSGNILSVASGMYQSLKEENKDGNKLKYFNNNQIVAVIGDAAFASGMAFEALNDIAFNKEPIIIILNDNEMSISKAVGALSKHLSNIKTSRFFRFVERGLRHVLDFNKFYYMLFDTYSWLESRILSKNLFQNLGFHYIGPIDGHNIKKLNKAINRAKWFSKQGSVILHVKTKKGFGLSEAVADQEGHFHSYDKNSTNENSFGSEATNKVVELMKNDKKIFVINPAMTRSSNCEKIIDLFPERYIDVGIAEEHAISKSSGMSLAGLKPIVYIYSSFLQRAYDQLQHDLSRLKLPVTLLIDRADVSGGDGPTHHGVYDVGFLKTLENAMITSPRNINQLNQLIDLSHNSNTNNIFCIRYPKWFFNDKHYINSYEIKKGEWEWFEKNNTKTVVISYGPYVNKILEEIYEKENVNIINAIFINNYHESEITKLFNKYDKIIVYERIKTNNGIASDLYKFKSDNNLRNEIIEMNYYKKPLDHGSTSGLDKRANMTILDIVKNIKK